MTIIKKILEFPLIIICSIFVCIGLFFYIPVDYIKYKSSPYYKKCRKKYKLYVSSGANYKFCNIILRNDLPIRILENPVDDSLACCYFVLGKTLILINYLEFHFDCETETWRICAVDGEEALTLDDYFAMEIDGVNDLFGKKICDDAVLLINKNNLDDSEAANADKRFLVYDKTPESVLKEFCSANVV